MAFTDPSVATFKNYFTRDFPYGTTPDTVLDSDIQKALDETKFNFNPALVADQTQYNTAFLYLAAHMLVQDLQASSQGISGAYNWLVTSKAVAGVAESFDIPERIKSNPQLAQYSKTRYGAKYIQFVWPRMIGQVFTVQGQTQP